MAFFTSIITRNLLLSRAKSLGNKLTFSTSHNRFIENNDVIDVSLEDKVIDKWAVLNPTKAKRAKLMNSGICLEDKIELTDLRNNPLKQVTTRLVRIYQPTKNAMQSGTHNTRHWQIDFDNQPRWENALQGWCSNSDALSNLIVKFPTQEEAIKYCETYGYTWYVQEKSNQKRFKPKDYAEIFSWDKRTRVSTK